MPTPPAYEWNPLWTDVVDDDNPAYRDAIRRMIMASINWFAAHPDADPTWQEPSEAAVRRAAGVSDDETYVLTGAWEHIYKPTNPYATYWFRRVSDACGKGRNAPSAFMMSKAVACGLLFKRDGWEAFNRFMLERPGEAAPS